MGVSAVDINGNLIGEWKLPDGIVWLMVCANNDHIYALGVRGAIKPSSSSAQEGRERIEPEKEQHKSHAEGRRLLEQLQEELAAQKDGPPEVVHLHRFEIP